MALLRLKKAHLLLPLFVPALVAGCDGPDIGRSGDEIIGGSDTQIKEVPYQVALLDGLGQFCGGSILTEEWVLTANHCVKDDDAGKIFVLAGVSKISDADQGQKIKVAEVHKFPGFNGDTRFGKDVAMIRLAKPLKFGANVKAIEVLGAAGEKAGLIDTGVVGKVSGWGVTDPNGVAGGPDHLQSVEVPIIDLKDAQKAYELRLTKDQLAAAVVGVGGKDACFGDSGGPFVVPNKAGDGVVLVGVVSWGQSCATPEFPGMYAKVSSFEKFIEDTLKLPKAPAPPVLVINEILADPEHDANGDGKVSTSQDEFVELVNAGEETLDLSGFALADAQKALLTFPAGTELAPGEVLVVFGGGKPKLAGALTATLGLNNKGDTIKVVAADGKVIASVTYGSMADSGESIVLATEGDPSSNFVLHTKKDKALASPGTKANGDSF